MEDRITASGQEAVRFRGVAFHRSGAAVLSDIHVNIPRNQLTAVIGESGSGKTTLLNHINGLLRPSEGSVEIFGSSLDYADLPRIRRSIGYALQAVGLLPHLSVGDNISLGARLAGWSQARCDERMVRLMGLLRLPMELAGRFPHQLSGGQQQRAGICRAMMEEPALLLLDEPFSGVDPLTRKGIHESFLALRQAEPATCVMVTHDLEEAIALAQHMVILRDGHVVQADDIETVFGNPANDFVARLLESGK